MYSFKSGLHFLSSVRVICVSFFSYPQDSSSPNVYLYVLPYQKNIVTSVGQRRWNMPSVSSIWKDVQIPQLIKISRADGTPPFQPCMLYNEKLKLTRQNLHRTIHWGLWKKEQRSCWWIKVFGCGLADNKRITLVCSCWREVHVPPHMPPSAKLDNINPVHCVLFGCCHLLLASMPIVWSHWLSICTFYVNDIFMCYIMYLSWFIHNFSSWKGLGYYLWNHVHKPLSTSDIYF